MRINPRFGVDRGRINRTSLQSAPTLVIRVRAVICAARTGESGSSLGIGHVSIRIEITVDAGISFN